MLRTRARDCLLVCGGGLGLLAKELLVARTDAAGVGLGRCKGMTMAGAGGVCGADWGCWVAGYTQWSSTMFAMYGAIDLCRGSPYREVSGGGFPGNLELPGYLGN